MRAVAGMADETTLLQAILADPDADAPRLAYADFMASQADVSSRARAEFIRTQIAIETMTLDDRRWPAIAGVERELLDQHRTVWERPLRSLLMPRLKEPVKWLTARLFGKGGAWGFRRGFVEDVSASVIGFMDADVHLVGVTPLRQVKLTNATSFVAQLSRRPELDRLRSLHLVSDAEFDEDMELLRCSAVEADLRVLEVRVPHLVDGSADLFQRLKGEGMVPGADPQLEEFPAWNKATPTERERIRKLANTPSFVQRLAEPDLASEAELLRLNDWVYLGEGPARAGLWATAKTFHDLEDSEGYVRRLLLFKSDRIDPAAYDALRQSPHFVAEHTA
jgi:uncharacterized protein (TIGR02996 family)